MRLITETKPPAIKVKSSLGKGWRLMDLDGGASKVRCAKTRNEKDGVSWEKKTTQKDWKRTKRRHPG